MRRSLLTARPAGRPSPLRRLLPVAFVGAALALSACQTQSPIQTDVTYQPADGVPVDLGPVQLRDLVVVGSGKDKAGVLAGAMSNSGAQAEQVSFALENSQPVSTTSPAHSQQSLSSESQVQLPSVPVNPGDVVQLSVSTATSPAQIVTVPVVPANHYYATLSPTAAPSATTSTTP
jgi:hypothetical protein